MGGGTHRLNCFDGRFRGLSPRGRGNLVLGGRNIEFEGSIPAWAGEPLIAASQKLAVGVYPRVGGGTTPEVVPAMIVEGLSPRGRGNLCVPIAPASETGSIPAWAGEPHSPEHSAENIWVYPRVGGGTSTGERLGVQDEGLSPRGRGNRADGAARTARRGSIPAWAGEPRQAAGTAGERGVYPRVGRGTSRSPTDQVEEGGLSPRGRGNHHFQGAANLLHGSIPAWAGEPRRRRGLRPSSGVYPRVGGGTQ